ncbi:MAG: VWA domain-containing protein [Acidobacteriia bacterium]|nr:VWA domain-containing protein [Terriglobia bacterium]
MRRLIGILAAVLLSGMLTFAQSKAPPAPETKPEQLKIPSIVVNVEKVVVPVTVKDSKGHLINDLKKTDFEVLEDGVPQEISDFTTDPRALSAVILVDTAMTGRAERLLGETLRSLTESFSEFDALAVYTFEDRVDKLVGFGNNRDIAYTKLKRIVDVSGSNPSVPGGPIFSGGPPSINGRPMDVGPPPNYGSLKPALKRITDAIFAAAMALKDQPKDRRKIILVISDGNDTGKNESSYQDTLHLLLDREIAVYGISNDEFPLLRHAEVTNVLPRFTADTGGSMFYSFKRETLENIYPALTEEVRNQYELTYSPKRHTDDSVFKSIEVKVDRPGVRVIARQGYYAVSVVPLTPEAK